MKKWVSYLSVAAFSIMLALLMLLNIFREKGTLSQSERRKLAQYPALTLDSVLSGAFMSKLETAALDQFTGRETWRTIKSAALFNLFRQSDKAGLYVYDESICKWMKQDNASVTAAAEKFQRLRAQYLSDKDTYFALIPDKGFYTEGYPVSDIAFMRDTFSAMEGFTYIDLTDALELSDYYRTDLHWDCTRISGVTQSLGEAMGFTVDTAALVENTLGSFAGAYLGQLSLPMEKDALKVYGGGFLDGVRASYLDERTLEFVDMPVYNADALANVDAYDVFLGGAKPIVVLENDNASSSRQLVIFRDSFTSSLAPLLAGSFSKITLVDLRYMASPILPDYVDFASATDALFIYGTELMLNSSTLLVK